MARARFVDTSWKPRRQAGGVYCSLGCGARCPRSAYDAAVKQATAVAKRLGPKWRPHVWENLGWHWEALSCSHEGHRVSVRKHDPGPYWASLQGVESASGKTPQRAVRAILANATARLNEKVREHRRLVDVCTKALGGRR